jgi:hypothetical protein
MTHIIWSNCNLNEEDWFESYREHCECNDIEFDESKISNYMYETNDMYLDDERINLNKQVDGNILIIADLGLWNGRKQGYKLLNTRNIADILYSDCDYVEWYGDGKNIKCTAHHHDGTNYYTYRVVREGRNIQNLLDAIYNGEEITSKKLNYYTKSLHSYVAQIYGWR